MRLRIVAPALASLAISGFAVAQTTTSKEDHSGHHPSGSPAAAPGLAQPTPMAPDAFEKQMGVMQDMHQRMRLAKTQAERAALMKEHTRLLQESMAMISQMRGKGAMPPPAPTAGAGQGAPGMPCMTGMEDMHKHMDRRMAMMEQVLQMMVDREVASPRK